MSDPQLRAHKATHNKSNSWWLKDARGIPLTRICSECAEQVINSYPPEVMGRRGNYEDVVEERIENDY
jgi:ribosomal protein L13